MNQSLNVCRNCTFLRNLTVFEKNGMQTKLFIEKDLGRKIEQDILL